MKRKRFLSVVLIKSTNFTLILQDIPSDANSSQLYILTIMNNLKRKHQREMAAMKIKQAFLSKKLNSTKKENETLKVCIGYLTEIFTLLRQFPSKSISLKND